MQVIIANTTLPVHRRDVAASLRNPDRIHALALAQVLHLVFMAANRVDQKSENGHFNICRQRVRLGILLTSNKRICPASPEYEGSTPKCPTALVERI